jgi:hypothetical protein
MDHLRFFSGPSYGEYISALPAEDRVYFEKNYTAWAIPAEIVQRAANSPFPPYILASTEGFCPDCRVNLPLLQRLCESVPGRKTEIRCHSRDNCKDIGVVRIPTFVFYDSEWNEVGRWVERPEKYKKALNDGTDADKKEAKRSYLRGDYNVDTLREILQLNGI